MKKREIITITFYPEAIIEYIKKKGFITARDLGKDFGYSNGFAQIEILSYLERLSIPVFSKFTLELLNELTEVAQALGIELNELNRRYYCRRLGYALGYVWVIVF